MMCQPVAKRNIDVAGNALETGESPGNAEFINQIQVMSAQEAAAEMEGRGKQIRLKTTYPAVGCHEIEGWFSVQEIRDAHGPAKMREIRAAAHADVLTEVDELAAGRVLE
jgi:hypothetical protein